jgi:hypothetical protein
MDADPARPTATAGSGGRAAHPLRSAESRGEASRDITGETGVGALAEPLFAGIDDCDRRPGDRVVQQRRFRSPCVL